VPTEPCPELIRLATAVANLEETPERILQVECGAGDGVLFLAREFPSARVRGIDRNPGAIRAAVARIGLDPEGRVAFKQQARRSIPYPDDFFDLIVQMDGPLAVGEIARALKPGRPIIVSEPGWLTRWRLERRFKSLASAATGVYLGCLLSDE
jgi:ubiquinone/menaquinone biosynthesis C-methylase UbiE